MTEIYEQCECGKVLVATSKSQMKYNLMIHKKSKGHKIAMNLNKKVINKTR